jgi:hypothetical protein
MDTDSIASEIWKVRENGTLWPEIRSELEGLVDEMEAEEAEEAKEREQAERDYPLDPPAKIKVACNRGENRPHERRLVRGHRVLVPGFEEFKIVVHHSVSFMGIEEYNWNVSEAKTRLSLAAWGETPHLAIKALFGLIASDTLTPEKLRAGIEQVAAQRGQEGLA